MRILYVTAHYPPDFVSGATLQVQRLAETMAAMGHEVAVFSGCIADADLADGEVRRHQQGPITVHWIGTVSRIEQDVDENWQNPHATRAIAELLRSFRPEVVHGHALQTLGADVVSLAAGSGVPTVVTMHDFWWWCPRLFLVDRELRPCDGLRAESTCACARDASWRRQRRAVLAPTLAMADLVLVPSEAMARALRTAGIHVEQLEVDENDVDPGSLAGTVDGPVAAPSSDVRFLYVGGDAAVKGRDVVVSAGARLAPLPGWRLDLRGVPAPLRSRWRRRRADPRIRYLPAYPPEATAAVLADADVLVIASIARESFSIAAREALGAGLAVITSDCLGPEEVVVDDGNGLVVPTGDDAALADAMRALVEDRDLLARLRRRAAEHPVTPRPPEAHAADLLARYRTLTGA
jgi:glycosyltransferase involved in cell wall biosynthesis